ncbi:unnamed protein product [Symbiodinium natans]|uniref:Uncharacterized protein n=1 Tax=Symbiodinium natans TaxID=878477 RepID=A0A812NH54_9DINO|nr:unnamed protein product [Symbiodinium natans]
MVSCAGARLARRLILAWLVLYAGWQYDTPCFSLCAVEADTEAPSWTYPLHPRCRDLRLVASSTYMAQSDSWQHAPEPGHKAPRLDKDRAPAALAQRLRTADEPLVMFVETRYLEEFLELLEGVATPPFVLLTAGSDVPLTQELQQRLSLLPALRAAYSTNLHRPREEQENMFHALPVGFLPKRLSAHNEALLEQRRSAAPPWTERSGRLLVPWMRLHCGHRWRRGYRTILASPEYREMVEIVDDKLPFPDYLAQLGSYDCTRTWESVWMGCKPLIYNDTDFDTRHYQRASIPTIPHPDDLSPELLRKLLSSKEEPVASDAEQLHIKYWTSRWKQDLLGPSNGR